MRRASALAVLALLLGAGCGSDSSGGDGGAAPEGSELTGTPWVQASSATAAATVEFAAGKVAGSGGCNRFGGSYQLDGAKLTIGTLHSTQIACAPPVDQLEREFLTALERVEAWEIDGDQLVLAQSGGGEPLRFDAASPQGRWRATSLRTPDAVISVLKDTEITADFTADGSLSGSAGCNDYGGTYTVDRGKIAISDVSATEMACDGPAGVMEQEQQYLAALAQAARYQLDAKGLTLLTSEGTIAATFQKDG